jgi:hypothetical protein
MIFFVAPEEDLGGMRHYLLEDGCPLQSRLRLLSFEEIVLGRKLPLGSYIFSAIDQLSPTQRAVAARCWQALSQASADIALLNRPDEVLCRYELLHTCFRLRLNSFRVFRASGFLCCTSFPVFLRLEREHNGSISGLLHNRRQLVKALAKAVLQGYRTRDIMIVEYCDTVDSSGVFRRYSAYIVGDVIIANSIVHSPNWVTKWHAKVCDPDAVREELAYVETNPHLNWLRGVFALAKIRYGRIDYGLKGSVPQLWEINTAPIISGAPGDDNLAKEQLRKLRAPVRQHFFPRFRNALAALDTSADPGRSVSIEVSPSEVRRIEAEVLTKRRLRARRNPDALAARLAARAFRCFSFDFRLMRRRGGGVQ